MDERPSTTAGPDGPGDARGAPDREERFEPWGRTFLRHGAFWMALAIAGGIVLGGLADNLVHRLASFFGIIMISLFLSFAIEPAADWLAARGMRRGAATGLVFLGVFAAFVFLLALLIPAIVNGTNQLIDSLPNLVNNLARYLARIGIHVDQARIEEELKKYSGQLVSGAGNLLGGVVGVATGIIGGIFRWATIALFTFFMVAQGPQMRRTILSRFEQERQRMILFVWEEAIAQTGGYFYSRLLLAVVNGTLMYALLRWRGVPFAAPLALFEGIVAEFIPIVGTYIAGAIPVLVALLYDPIDAAFVVGWIVIYQQLENYILSPRLTAKTMSLTAPIAFAAALVGGALGGILFAFLALPAAGVIQAAFKTYGRYYEVVDDSETAVQLAVPEGKGGSGSRLWNRRRSREPDERPPDDPSTD